MSENGEHNYVSFEESLAVHEALLSTTGWLRSNGFIGRHIGRHMPEAISNNELSAQLSDTLLRGAYTIDSLAVVSGEGEFGPEESINGNLTAAELAALPSFEEQGRLWLEEEKSKYQVNRRYIDQRTGLSPVSRSQLLKQWYKSGRVVAPVLAAEGAGLFTGLDYQTSFHPDTMLFEVPESALAYAAAHITAKGLATTTHRMRAKKVIAEHNGLAEKIADLTRGGITIPSQALRINIEAEKVMPSIEEGMVDPELITSLRGYTLSWGETGYRDRWAGPHAADDGVRYKGVFSGRLSIPELSISTLLDVLNKGYQGDLWRQTGGLYDTLVEAPDIVSSFLVASQAMNVRMVSIH